MARISGNRSPQVRRTEPKKADAEKTHQIKKGDTLSEIAQAYGVKTEDLLALNPQIKDPDLIYAGSELKLPPGAKLQETAKAKGKAEVAKDNYAKADATTDATVGNTEKAPVNDPRMDANKSTGMLGLLQNNKGANKSTEAKKAKAPTKAEIAQQQREKALEQFKNNQDPKLTTKGAAERLFKAMDGWGTNEGEIHKTLADRSPEEIAQIKSDYKTKYGKSLDKALASELGGDDLKKAQLYMKGNKADPAGRDSQMLQMAMRGIGSDEKAILDTLHGKSGAERKAIAEQYKKDTGRSLKSDLKSELSGADEVYALATLKKGKIGPEDKLRAAMVGSGTDEKSIMKTLEGKSREELMQIKEDYKKSYGRTLYTDLKQELSGDDWTQAKALLQDGNVSDADKLKMAMQGLGTDEKAINNVLEGKTKEQIGEIKSEYNKKYGSLDKELKSELSGERLAEVQSLMENGKLSPAEKINQAVRGFGTDEDKLLKTLDGLSPDERKEAKIEYQKKYGKTLASELKEELSGNTLKKAEILLDNGKMTAAEKIHFATKGAGTNVNEVMEALEKASPAERKNLEAEYKATYGQSLKGLLKSELSGRDEDKALLLLENGKLSPQQKAEVAMDGIGTRETDLFNALESASPAERKAMMNDEKFMDKLTSEVSGPDLERSMLLLNNGKLTREEQLHFAMEGAGTDEAAVHKALEGLSPKEREEVKSNYMNKYGRTLESDLKSELGSRDLWKTEDALAPEPVTLRERLDRAETRAARERNSGTAVGTASDKIMDTFSTSGFEVDQSLREYKSMMKKAESSPEAAAKMGPRLVAGENKIDAATAEYQKEKDEVADAAAEVATMAAAATAVAATGGMAAPAALAIVAGTAGATRVATKKLVTGNSYDLVGADGAKDFAIGAAEGASTFAMGKAGDHMTAAIGKRYLAAQGTDVSRKGVMMLGRRALSESGETMTRKTLEKASFEVLKNAGNEVINKSVVNRVGINAVIGGVKGAVFSAPTAATKSALNTEGMEFSDAIKQVMLDTGDASIQGAKGWAVGTAAYQVGAITSETIMSKAKVLYGSRIARRQGIQYSDKQLLKAGYEVMGDQAKNVSREELMGAGQRHLFHKLGQSTVDRNMLAKSLDIGANELITRGTAAQPSTLFNNLAVHDTWAYGLDEAVVHLFSDSSAASVKGATVFSTGNISKEIAARRLKAGQVSQAGLSNLVIRSMNTVWR
jgi:LysM repeat protein